MKTNVACTIVNITMAIVFSIPTVAFFWPENDIPVDSDRVRTAISEPVAAMEPDIQSRVTESLVEPVEAIVEPVQPIMEVPETVYYDVPLSTALQDHIFELCEDAGIDPTIIIAIIEKESMFDVDIVGDNGRALGLMQIQSRWHYDRMTELNCHDLLDPFQNVTVGIHFVEELFTYSDSIEWVLMAYNGGPAYANRKVAAGEVSTYASMVLEKAGRY